MQQQLGSRMEQKSTAPVPPQDVDIVVGDSASKIDASKAQRAVTLEPEETVRSTTVERRTHFALEGHRHAFSHGQLMRKDNFPVLAEKKLYVVSDASTLDLDRPWKGRNRGVVLQLVGRHCRAYNEVAYRDEQHQERSTHFERLASPSTLEFSW